MKTEPLKLSQLENYRIIECLNDYSPKFIQDFNRSMPVVAGNDIYILVWRAGDRTYELELDWNNLYDDFWIRWDRFTNLVAFL
jgi:hypothetical protein